MGGCNRQFASAASKGLCSRALGYVQVHCRFDVACHCVVLMTSRPHGRMDTEHCKLPLLEGSLNKLTTKVGLKYITRIIYKLYNFVDTYFLFI